MEYSQYFICSFPTFMYQHDVKWFIIEIVRKNYTFWVSKVDADLNLLLKIPQARN